MNVAEIALVDELSDEDMVWKEYIIQGSIDMTSLVDKMKYNRLKWFQHIVKRKESEAVRMVIKINIG